jgi:hypothetical protein
MLIRSLTFLAAGAALIYFLDPESGRRRRARLRDQVRHARHRIGDYAEGKAKHLRNRARGVAHDISEVTRT